MDFIIIKNDVENITSFYATICINANFRLSVVWPPFTLIRRKIYTNSEVLFKFEYVRTVQSCSRFCLLSINFHCDRHAAQFVFVFLLFKANECIYSFYSEFQRMENYFRVLLFYVLLFTFKFKNVPTHQLNICKYPALHRISFVSRTTGTQQFSFLHDFNRFQLI